MPIIELKDGRKIEVKGNPSQDQIDNLLNDLASKDAGQSSNQKTFANGDDFRQTIQPQNVLGQLFNVPGAAIRSAIQGRGYVEGATNPDAVPRFQEQALNAYYNGVSDFASKMPNDLTRNAVVAGSVAGGTLASAAGMAADVATNPVDVLASFIGKAPGVNKVIDAIGATAPAQALGKFLTKERNLIGHTYRSTKKAVETADAVLNAPQKDFDAVVKADIPRKIDETISSIRGKSDINLEQLNNDLDAKTNAKLPVFREVLKKYFSGNSKKYSDTLGSISEKLSKNGESITRGEFKQILDNVANDAQEQLLDTGKPFEELSLLRKKYNIDESSIESPILERINGVDRPITTTTKTNATDELDFKEIVNDIKKVKNALSAKVKMGYRYTPEDIVAAKLMSRWGDYVSTKVPEFAQLNKEYKPIIHAMDIASKEFKPNTSDFDIKGVKFLKDFALGKNSGVVDRDKLLSFIEKGTENFPGVGDFTKDIKDLGSNINTVKNTTDEAINILISKKSNVKDLLSELSLAKERHAAAKGGLVRAAAIGTTVIGAEETYGPKVLRKLIRQ